MSADLERRFGGITRLYGAPGQAKICGAHVAVVGVGGVGSWAVEALARSGIGALTLIDLDMVAESNTNRQIQALGDNYGRAKVDVMAERIRGINPACRVNTIEDFVTPENVADMLHGDFDYVLDAIDQVKTKAAMIAHCQRAQIAIITAGAAGGQFDPTRITIADLSRTEQDPLLSKVRSLLRREYGFSRKPKEKFGIAAVYSDEPLRYPERTCDTASAPAGLNCAGFGSSICVTAAFGLAAAAHVLREISQ
ncbi:MAG: UBA/THIF-type binding fold protein [Proteobacteria bacterium]|nr:UBA/THIF-type binding fold protein [Pseudomonadota bacterium]